MARQWHDGHSTAILCVGAAGGPEGLLASGCEGGEVTVWNQGGSIVGRLTLSSEEENTSVAFSPAAPSLLYVSHGETVSVLDPRNLKRAVEEFQGVGEEEINALALSDTGSALALADDSGAVRVLELPGGKVCRTLRRHTNICSSVAFRPHRPNNLVSAGLDMQVMLWSLQKTRPLWTLNLQEVAEEEEEHQQRAGQLFNPPLAHCISVASCGNVMACAAEDGRVHLMRVGSGSKLEQQGAIKAHSQGVSQAHFINFLSHPYWLATGGNDGQVALWDLSQDSVVAPEGKAKSRVAADHRRRVKGRAKGKHRSKGKANATSMFQSEKEAAEREGEDEEKGAAEGSSADQSSVDTEVLKSGPRLSFSHGDKVNWVCPAMLKGEPSLVVADQSSSLSIYSLSGL
ncbi:WD repeat-containing protein 53 [Lampris incognitus]|uniref:WD repeat-containing protein 53 n=1 Tax=Lampris incognitus TaxID=2546036 RepID=UPI0024B4AE21|nr:WD repeat-containing protein 53 [Lampris incognitus]